MKKLIILGAGGHGRVIADIAEKNGYGDIAFLDDSTEAYKCGDYPVVGLCRDFYKYDCDFIVGIGNSKVRMTLQEQLLDAGKSVAVLIHPSAVIGKGVNIGCGSVVMAGAVINPGAVIGRGCIINTCSSVDHDCAVEDFAHISVGAHLAGSVHVGKGTFIGIGAVVVNNIDIADNCIVGAGAAVIRNIDKKGTYAGVPAKKISD